MMQRNISNLCAGAALAAVLMVAIACAPAAECLADDDCPADAACSAGRCEAIGEGEGEEGEGEEGEGEEGEGEAGEGEGEGEGGEGEGEGGEGEGEGEGSTICTLDDEVLGNDDVGVLLGLPIRTLLADSSFADIPVDVQGATIDGVRTWDFTAAIEDEEPFSIEALPLTDQWFADDFADAPAFQDGRGAYVAPLTFGTFGVFERTDTELVLLGVASDVEGRDLITYDPPILVLQLPVALNDTFSSSSTGSGTFSFNPFYVSSDDYTTTVDARGVARTLAGDFQVLRLRVEQTVQVGLFVVSTIQYVWMTPCLGAVVQVTSGDGETDVNFTEAASVRRLSAPGDP